MKLYNYYKIYKRNKLIDRRNIYYFRYKRAMRPLVIYANCSLFGGPFSRSKNRELVIFTVSSVISLYQVFYRKNVLELTPTSTIYNNVKVINVYGEYDESDFKMLSVVDKYKNKLIFFSIESLADIKMLYTWCTEFYGHPKAVSTSMLLGVYSF